MFTSKATWVSFAALTSFSLSSGVWSSSGWKQSAPFRSYYMESGFPYFLPCPDLRNKDPAYKSKWNGPLGLERKRGKRILPSDSESLFPCSHYPFRYSYISFLRGRAGGLCGQKNLMPLGNFILFCADFLRCYFHHIHL